MSGLLRAEWIKLSRRWVFPVMVIVLAVLTGLSAVVLMILPTVSPDAIVGLPVLDRHDASILGVQSAVGQTWFPLILAVVMLGSEVTSTAWASALTRDARRLFHIVARLIVLGLASFVATGVAIGIWEGIAAATTEGAVPFSGADWLGVLGKVLLIQVTWVALGLGAISLIRSTGVAIGVVIAYSFLEGVATLWEPFGNVALSSASTALFGSITADVSAGVGVTGIVPMDSAQAFAVVAGWAVLGLALAWLGLARRDA